MRSRPSTTAAVTATVILLTAPAAIAQQSRDPDTTRLRTLYFQRDYETGALEGVRLTAKTPDRSSLRAWYYLNLVRTGKEDEAVEGTRKMTATAPGDGWGWLALAGTLNYKGGHTKESIDASVKALELMPDHPDAIWMRGLTTSADSTRRQEAVDFIDKHRTRVANPAEILVTRANTLYNLAAGPPRDEAKTKESLAAFEEVQRLDPSNINALYLHATYLQNRRQSNEAYELLKKAVGLAPGSTAIRQAYWNSIRNGSMFDADRKRVELDADVAAFMKIAGDRPGALQAVSSLARDMKMVDLRKQVDEKILSSFGDSPQAEWVIVYRWRELEGPDSLKNPEFRRILTEYVARPQHHHKGLLGEAYRELFFVLLEDKTVPSEELLRVANGMVKYEVTNTHITHVNAPIALADKKLLLTDAERIARDGLDALRKKADSQRSFYKSEGEYEDSRDRMVAMGHDALGWVLFVQGRNAEAEKELLRSYELNRESRENLHHLGKFFEAKGDIARAEDYYVKGLGIQRPGTNPSEASLRTLYEKRHGNTSGFDGYIAELRERDRVMRKEKILGQRITSPPAPAAFSLKTLDGKRLSLEDVKGKIVVINFWGIWCGWCVKEMPDIQKLHERYANDPDVVILTIDNDKNPDDVAPWMKERKFTFPVLFDDGYVSKMEVHGFPTTWFLDRDGRKVFEKVGWSEKLVEEFGWRIEAIRVPGTAAAR